MKKIIFLGQYRRLYSVRCTGNRSFFLCPRLVRQLNVVYTPADSKESTADITNPFCGFYKINGYVILPRIKLPGMPTSGAREAVRTLRTLSCFWRSICGIMLIRISVPTLFRSLTAFLRSAKEKQIILRFLYDWDGKAKKRSLLILPHQNHIQQVSATVNAHADCIYILQGTFLSATMARMNNTNYGDIDQMRQLAETLAKNISPSIYLAVRTPAQLRGILYSRTPMAGQSDEGSLASRLGLFNDGMLGSVYDLGTYDDTPLTSRQ